MKATAIIMLVLTALLCGCTTTKYVPVETVRTEYRDREVERLVADTVRDTRVVWIKGDTVVDIRDRWHTQREYICDTVSIIQSDTIREPYPVERPLSRWEQTKMDFGGIAMGALVGILSIALLWLIKKFRK